MRVAGKADGGAAGRLDDRLGGGGQKRRRKMPARRGTEHAGYQWPCNTTPACGVVAYQLMG